jgi:hypothetical protein
MQEETDGAFLVLFNDKSRQGSSPVRGVVSIQPWDVRPAAKTASVVADAKRLPHAVQRSMRQAGFPFVHDCGDLGAQD